VRNATALGQRELGRADIEMAEHLQRVAIHHLAVE